MRPSLCMTLSDQARAAAALVKDLARRVTGAGSRPRRRPAPARKKGAAK